MSADFGIRDIITIDYLKNTTSLGVDLTLDNGDPFPDEMYLLAIDGAINMIESELNIVIDEQTVKSEKHDAASDNRRAWWPMDLDLAPLKKVTDIKITYGQYTPTQIPLSWVNITSEIQSSIALVPTSETLGTFSFNNSIPLLIDPITNYSYYRRVPAYFNLSYKAGFNFRKGTATIPAGQTELLIELGETLIDKPNFTFTVTDDGRIASPATPTTARAIDTGVNNDTFTIKLNQAGVDGPVIVDWEVHTVPLNLIRAVCYVAGCLPLDIAGDLIAGAGIAQQSLSVDGLTQQINTTASATNAGYGARILSYKRQINDMMKALRQKFNRIKFGVL